MTEERKFTNAEIIERLQKLHNKLEWEGRYVDSNTCWLALELLKTICPECDNKGGGPGIDPECPNCGRK